LEWFSRQAINRNQYYWKKSISFELKPGLIYYELLNVSIANPKIGKEWVGLGKISN
jgi:hypothetical protein